MKNLALSWDTTSTLTSQLIKHVVQHWYQRYGFSAFEAFFIPYTDVNPGKGLL